MSDKRRPYHWDSDDQCVIGPAGVPVEIDEMIDVLNETIERYEELRAVVRQCILAPVESLRRVTER